jgi:ABC-type polar amino acid transport system ATPase subunit
MSELRLAVRDVHKAYNRTDVLNGVSLDLGPGQVKAVLGPSGSGKSTLLRCIALLEPIDRGEVELDGRALGWKTARGARVRESERELALHRSEIGMVFQQFNLFPHMTALANVMLGLVEVRKTPKGEAAEQAQAMLARVGLSKREQAYPTELSGGQQQRVAIARALVMRPKVMLFDEPTSALDAELVRGVLDVMEDLARGGITMLVVTHELRFARNVADSVVMMDEGVVVEEAPPDRFFDAPETERARRFLDAVE